MADVLHGNASANQLNATANRTQVYGLAGNDTLASDGKSDVLLVGGSGSDSLIISGGNGTLSGGAGSDTFELNYSASQTLSAVIEDVDPASDKIVVNFDGTATPTLNSVASGSDVVLSDSDGQLNVTLKGVRENDYFDGTASDEAWEVLKLTNDEREAKDLSPLTASDGLTAGASVRAQEITEVYSHTRPDGTNMSTVLEKSYWSYGENIAAGQNSPANVVTAWMNSPGHRANILTFDYQKLGVGYVYEDSLKYEHYWVQLFGSTLTTPETVSTANLLTTPVEVNTVGTDSKLVTLTEGNDTYNNSVFGATIAAKGGNDSIINSGFNVSISGGTDNDTLQNSGSFVTLNAGTGNDLIHLSNAAQEILIQYATGDGNDTISGFNASDILSISGGEFTPVTVGNDVVVGVGTNSITLTGAANFSPKIEGGTRSKLYIGTENADSIVTAANDVTIQARGGNDTITNRGANASINAGAGNDSITNSGQNVVFFHEGGNDTIGGFNSTSTLQIAGGSYDSFASGNDLILMSNTDSIRILDAADLSINIADANGNSVTVGNAKYIVGTEGADNISNTLDSATIAALGGNDTINNNGERVSVLGGAGNDYVNNNQQQRTVYIYESGNDTIEGFNETDMLNIGGYSYSTVASDSDLIVNIIDNAATVGTVTLKDYSYDQGANIISTALNPGNDVYNYENNLPVTGTPNDDTIGNSGSNVTVNALAGNDYVLNSGSNVTLNGGADNDDIMSYASRNTAIDGGAGNDYVMNGWSSSDSTFSDFSTITGGDGDDYIYNCGGKNVSISGGNGDDSLINNIAYNGNESVSSPDNSTLNGGNGNDYLQNQGANVSISGGNGDDYISNSGASVSIDSGDGNDNISNSGASVLIDGGAGNDEIFSSGSTVTINGGAGNDYISNYGSSNVSILAGTGNDQINLASNSQNNFIRYKLGDGNDTVWGISENDTLHLLADESLVSSIVSGDDVIFNVSSGSVLLIGARNRPPHVVIGESGTSGGGSGSGGSGGSGSGSGSGGSGGSGSGSGSGGSGGSGSGSGSGGSGGSGSGSGSGGSGGSGSGSGSGGTGGNDSGGTGGNNSGGTGGNNSGGTGGNTSGGTSGNEGMNSDASGSKSAIGSRGRSNSTSSETGGSVTGVPRQSVDYTAEAQQIINAIEYPNNTSRAVTTTGEVVIPNVDFSSMQSTANLYIYAGGNQIISNYQPGDKIIFAEIYTGSFYDSEGNYCVGSSTGALVIQNSVDKIVDFLDVNGNDLFKAYAASTAGVIDGRGLGGFEVINGSAGADAIFAGDGGSQLWGGFDVAADTLVGGGGMDIFIGGRTQGADVFANASSADIVHLNDASLSDIVATEENNGAIAIAFNNGNAVAIQSSELLSAAVMLADGAAYRYDHANKSWQNA